MENHSNYLSKISVDECFEKLTNFSSSHFENSKRNNDKFQKLEQKPPKVPTTVDFRNILKTRERSVSKERIENHKLAKTCLSERGSADGVKNEDFRTILSQRQKSPTREVNLAGNSRRLYDGDVSKVKVGVEFQRNFREFERVSKVSSLRQAFSETDVSQNEEKQTSNCVQRNHRGADILHRKEILGQRNGSDGVIPAKNKQYLKTASKVEDLGAKLSRVDNSIKQKNNVPKDLFVKEEIFDKVEKHQGKQLLHADGSSSSSCVSQADSSSERDFPSVKIDSSLPRESTGTKKEFTDDEDVQAMLEKRRKNSPYRFQSSYLQQNKEWEDSIQAEKNLCVSKTQQLAQEGCVSNEIDQGHSQVPINQVQNGCTETNSTQTLRNRKVNEKSPSELKTVQLQNGLNSPSKLENLCHNKTNSHQDETSEKSLAIVKNSGLVKEKHNEDRSSSTFPNKVGGVLLEKNNQNNAKSDLSVKRGSLDSTVLKDQSKNQNNTKFDFSIKRGSYDSMLRKDEQSSENVLHKTNARGKDTQKDVLLKSTTNETKKTDSNADNSPKEDFRSILCKRRKSDNFIKVELKDRSAAGLVQTDFRHVLTRHVDTPNRQAPVFQMRLIDHKVTEGQPVIMECSVNGVPQPDITWSMNGNIIKVSSILLTAIIINTMFYMPPIWSSGGISFLSYLCLRASVCGKKYPLTLAITFVP